jgi:hypothetical protein
MTQLNTTAKLSRRIDWTWALGGWAVHTLVIAIFVYVLVVMVPPLGRRLNELELDRPATTHLLLFLSQQMLRYWWLAVPISLGNLVLWLFVVSHQRFFAWTWLIVPLLFAALVGFYIVAGFRMAPSA